MENTTPETVRFDHQVIAGMIDPNSRVLDLGCGDGDLLSLLIKQKNCRGTGIEIDEEAIYKCVEKGLTVSHGDIDTGLRDYSNKRFDYVILNESLQQVLHPKQVILEALRVGKQAIVGVPNFCHYRSRFQVTALGKVPVTKELPYEWYDTPNLRFFSIKDFNSFCKANDITIRNFKAIGSHRNLIQFFPNLCAHTGIYLLEQ